MPPDIKQSWDDNDTWAQAHLLAYNEIREREEHDDKVTMYKCLGAKI